MEQIGIETQPDFKWVYVYVPIRFVIIGSGEYKEIVSTGYLINGIESANCKTISVLPDIDLSAATTVMLTKNFSQLPVMTTEREGQQMALLFLISASPHLPYKLQALSNIATS